MTLKELENLVIGDYVACLKTNNPYAVIAGVPVEQFPLKITGELPECTGDKQVKRLVVISVSTKSFHNLPIIDFSGLNFLIKV